VRYVQHGNPDIYLSTFLGTYIAFTRGVNGSGDTTLRLDNDNEPQPDLLLRIESECGGQCSVDEKGYLIGAPELVAEISSSSVSYDLHEKLNAYRRSGVCEYLVWRAEDVAIDWFSLQQGRYDRIAIDTDGVLRSRIFAGLWLDEAAMLRGDLFAVLNGLKQGLASPEHAAFVQRLEEARARSQRS
jgi:Uma2 family endonuclease